MKKFIKENIKIIMLLVINTLIVGSITGVFAYSYAAKDIEYTPRDTSWKVNNVEDAIKSLKNDKGGVSNNYSFDEQIVGTWINGKPIYQKTIVLTSSYTIPSNTWTNVINKGTYNLNNIEYIVNAVTMREGHKGYIGQIAYTANPSTDSYIKAQVTGGSWSIEVGTAITLQYTKTTDSASNN